MVRLKAVTGFDEGRCVFYIYTAGGYGHPNERHMNRVDVTTVFRQFRSDFQVTELYQPPLKITPDCIPDERREDPGRR